MKRKIDMYRIKKIIFRYKLDRHIRKGIKVYSNILMRLLIIVHEIGYPEKEREKELLKKVIEEYDKTILKLEENMRYARLYVKDEN